METFLAGEYTAEEIFAEEPYQCWQFGPALLEEDGRPRAWFNIAEELLGAHPRTAIGYFEPGHYCFVVVDGRRPGHSSGADMHALAQIMSDLGCLSAYNLDGGACSMMVFQGEWANQPCPAGAFQYRIIRFNQGSEVLKGHASFTHQDRPAYVNAEIYRNKEDKIVIRLNYDITAGTTSNELDLRDVVILLD